MRSSRSVGRWARQLTADLLGRGQSRTAPTGAAPALALDPSFTPALVWARVPSGPTPDEFWDDIALLMRAGRLPPTHWLFGRTVEAATRSGPLSARYWEEVRAIPGNRGDLATEAERLVARLAPVDAPDTPAMLEALLAQPAWLAGIMLPLVLEHPCATPEQAIGLCVAGVHRNLDEPTFLRALRSDRACSNGTVRGHVLGGYPKRHSDTLSLGALLFGLEATPVEALGATLAALIPTLTRDRVAERVWSCLAMLPHDRIAAAGRLGAPAAELAELREGIASLLAHDRADMRELGLRWLGLCPGLAALSFATGEPAGVS